MTFDPVSTDNAKAGIRRLLDEITRLEAFGRRLEERFPELTEDICWDAD